MERRKEPRYETATAATVTVLPEDGVSIPALLLNVSGRGMGLQISTPIAVNSMVRVEAGNSLYLGDICFCRKDAEGRYMCGVRLEHVLGDVQGLALLAKRASGEISYLERPQFVNAR